MGAGHGHALYVHEHSPLHRMAPEAKLAAAFGIVVAVAVSPRHAVWAFACFAVMLGVIAATARLPARFVLARMAAVLPFILFAFLIPFVAGGERVDVVGIAVSREGLWGMWNVIAKATLGVTVSILLAGTTEIPDILRGLERLRAPRAMTAIAGFMVRYLEIVAAELGRMRTAMKARGYDPRWLWQAKPVAASLGSMFVRSYERGERVHAAMVSRGFTGSIPDLRTRRATSRDWTAAALVSAVAVAVALVALVTT